MHRRAVLGLPAAVVAAGPGAAAPRIDSSGAKPRDLADLGVVDAARLIASRRITSVELARRLLARIDSFNPRINAFITVDAAAVIANAAACDAEMARGVLRGPLHGVPLVLKDNIDTAGVRTTAASAVFADRIPSTDAEVWRRLRAAGAILLGKANMHEFAGGASSVPSHFGPVRNPWALDREAGGSSGGSAAAMAARLGCGAIGTDTGGSVRIPAAHCGVVGFKPTYGLAPIRGVVPLVPSLDHVGTITRSVADAALLLEVMAGYDRLDITSVERPAVRYLGALTDTVSRFRLGAPRKPFFDGLEPDISSAMETALDTLARLTAGITDAPAPHTEGFTDLGSIEIAAYHRELYRDGAHLYTNHFGGVLGRIFSAADDVAAKSCSDRLVDHVRATERLQLLRRTTDDMFADIDLLVLPTMRRTPRDIAYVTAKENSGTPAENPALPVNCVPFNILGLPAISLPCGVSSTGMPVGLMIVGPRFRDRRVLAMAHAYEQATAWHRQRPPLFA